MLARLQQLTTISLIALTLAWAIFIAGQGLPFVAIGGALFIIFAYAFVLAAEMLLSVRINRDDAVPPADAAALLSAWWGEVQCAARVFFWSQPFRSQAVSDRMTYSGPSCVGIVFVHGFVCNRGIWNPWLRRLETLEIPFVAVNLEPVFGGIDRYTAAIDEAVRRLEAATGRPPIVVAHSMGGLAVRAWLAAHNAASHVQHIITLGTPHRGTVLARIAVATNAKQMRPHSPWLQALARSEPGGGRYTAFTCYFSHCDNIVMPASSATLPGADNRQMHGVGHVQMASDERIFRDILGHALPQTATPRTG